MTLAQILLDWYDLQGRDLPWRDNPTPYAILVSEIMLQQTRVEAVRPLFTRFMNRFPTIHALAASSQDEVLTYWQGLGYYSRARRLHQAAQIIVNEHGGAIPQDKRTLLSLPGIGEYTCGAILSIAFGQPEMAVDGNLLRIGARLFLVLDPISRMKTKAQIQKKFQNLLPSERPGDFNQALMDLGSAICLPKNPRCEECPICFHCQAHSDGAVLEVPVKEAAKPPTPTQVDLYLVESAGTILLRKREVGGFLQGMWEIPWQERTSQAPTAPLAVAESVSWLASLLESWDPKEVHKMEYVFSHRHWFMTIYHYTTAHRFYTPQEQDTHYRWQPLDALNEVALPTVFKRVLKVLS